MFCQITAEAGGKAQGRRGMNYYDITREMFGTPVYPGDPKPEAERLLDIRNGDSCNLTYLRMCAHNGTHMDAPLHFIEDGASIEMLPLKQVMGPCRVVEFDGVVDERTARKMTDVREKKILWKGEAVFSEAAARYFVERGIELVGVELPSIGDKDAPEAVHRILLGADMAVLEGLDLSGVKAGTYFLCAQPLKLKGCEGAPCRAVLIEGGLE